MPRNGTHAGIPPTHEGCVLCWNFRGGSEAGATPPFPGIPFGSPAPGAHLAPFGKAGKSIFRSRQSRVLTFRRWKGRRILVRAGRQSRKRGLPEIERPFSARMRPFPETFVIARTSVPNVLAGPSVCQRFKNTILNWVIFTIRPLSALDIVAAQASNTPVPVPSETSPQDAEPIFSNTFLSQPDSG